MAVGFGGGIDLGNPVADHPLNRGLDAWWLGLPHNSGGTRLFDLLGRWPGTLTNGAGWGAGWRGGEFAAVSLDGSNDFVDAGNISSSAFAAEFAVGLAFYTATVATRFIFAKGDGSSNGFAMFTRATNNRVEVRIDSNTTAGTDNHVAAGVWNYVVATRLGTQVTAWVGNDAGAFRQTLSVGDSTDGSNTSAVRIGSTTALSSPFAGRIGDVRVCGSRGVSASEAWQWYDQWRRGHPDTLRRWRRVGYDAGAAASNQTLTPGVASATAAGVNPTLTTGSVTISSGVGTGTGSVVDTILSPGALSLTITLASGVGTAIDPTEISGSVSIQPDVAGAVAVGVDASINNTTVLSPNVATATATGIDPTITPSAIILIPSAAVASATVSAPSIVAGSTYPWYYTHGTEQSGGFGTLGF